MPAHLSSQCCMARRGTTTTTTTSPLLSSPSLPFPSLHAGRFALYTFAFPALPLRDAQFTLFALRRVFFTLCLHYAVCLARVRRTQF
ncbi:hypothetical protein E2C01_097429 [Portunus trituberculatus]|uniref:Uncharacterized protein n=1 Tax=Portunus trituberculatus TaxID=210409 RepID=A0A5B7JYG8_PORTR|nr:hypothetical protein [Portunus trituberculatus]